MAELLKGAPCAKALRERGTAPCLAILRAGERGDDLAYERAALKRCAALGVETRTVLLSADVSREALLDALRVLNDDPAVHGILPLRPLPHDAAVCAALMPEKDVDGVTAAAMAALYAGAENANAPCTAAACLELLKYYHIPLAGRRVLVIGRSLVIGKPAAMLLLRENATVTIAHSKSEELAALCREADVLLVAAGRAGLIGAEHVREGQTVLDVGIHPLPDGSLCGDVRFDEVEPVVEAITPVPGGVGAVTTAVLALQTIRAAGR